MRVRSTILLLFVLGTVLFGFDKSGILAGPRSVLGGLLSPVQVGWYRLEQAASEKWLTVTRIGSLSEDNFRLREENDQLKEQIATLSGAKKENDALRAQLGVAETESFQLLLAQTLGFSPALGAKELQLSVGSTQGVQEGQVVVSGKVALGKISRVQADRSTLRLITDPQTKVLAIAVGGAKGLLIGQFQASAKLTKVLQEEKLNISEIILTSGEGDWPKGLVVGEVIKVTKRDNELFQEAEVRPLVDYERLEQVFVILGEK